MHTKKHSAIMMETILSSNVIFVFEVLSINYEIDSSI